MLPHNYLTEILDYSVCTEYLTWKVDKGSNKVKGQKAGSLRPDGYIHIRIDGKYYLAHNLIWFYIMEEWPEDELDHEDYNKGNNNFFNLREANRSQNNAHKKLTKSNKSGYKGVCWSKSNKKHHARIKKDGKSYHIGYFDCAIEAAKARDKKDFELNGKFAVLNFKNEGESE